MAIMSTAICIIHAIYSVIIFSIPDFPKNGFDILNIICTNTHTHICVNLHILAHVNLNTHTHTQTYKY